MGEWDSIIRTLTSLDQEQLEEQKITLEEIRMFAEEGYGDMIKAVADISTGMFAIGGEFHADGEQILLQQGSQQINLWGFNIYPDRPLDDMLEYDSLINIRPKDNNRTTEIQDPGIKEKIFKIVRDKLIL